MLGTYGCCGALLVLWLVFRISERKSSVGRILGPLFKMCAILGLVLPTVECGSKRDEHAWKPPPRWIGEFRMFCLPWVYLGAAIFLGYRGMNRLSRRWPRVAEMLLVKREENQDENEAGQVDFQAWLALCFFFTNLVVSVLCRRDATHYRYHIDRFNKRLKLGAFFESILRPGLSIAGAGLILKDGRSVPLLSEFHRVSETGNWLWLRFLYKDMNLKKMAEILERRGTITATADSICSNGQRLF
ncbi:hypothetical protein C8R43DRAFT_951462 [Mycena crocata]|nr:hypothetical protein C8R43DRAFT_951462 [Mycena crocata]